MSIITVKSVSTDSVKKGNNKPYYVATVAYTDNGKEFSKKIMSFSNPSVYAAISKAEPGDAFDVTVTKEGDFYNWTAIKAASEVRSGNTATAPARTAPSTYETADERKVKQLYIVRQSSIANALEFVKSNGQYGTDFTQQDVLDIAQTFVDFVYGTDEVLDEHEDVPH